LFRKGGIQHFVDKNVGPMFSKKFDPHFFIIFSDSGGVDVSGEGVRGRLRATPTEPFSQPSPYLEV
jgi:hypothetical protein